MGQESIPLKPPSASCELCGWLEVGYQTSLDEMEDGEDKDPTGALASYVVEILLHRRLMHLSADHPN